MFTWSVLQGWLTKGLWSLTLLLFSRPGCGSIGSLSARCDRRFLPQTRQKTIARPPSRIAPPTPPTTPPTTDFLFDERPELPDPPLLALSPGAPEDVAEAKAAAITWLDVEVMLRVTLPLVVTIVVTTFCVTLPVGVMLEGVVWEDPSFDVEDFDCSESLDCGWVVEVVELVVAAPWSEVIAVSEDVLVVESVVWVSTDWEADIDEGLAEGLGEADGERVVVDVLLSWRYWRGFSISDAKDRLARRMQRANMVRWNMLGKGARANYVLDSRDQVHVLAF